MKHFGAILVAFFTLAAASARAQLEFATNSNSTITVVGYKGPGGDLEIPAAVNGLPVVKIGDGAFYGWDTITSVTIPSTVTSIGNSAFYSCLGMENITIADSVQRLGGYVFFDCEGLTNILLSENVTNIGIDPFGYCMGLIDIVVNTNNSYYSSGGGVLFNSNQSVLIAYPGSKNGTYCVPDTVTNIADYALAGASVQNVMLPSGLLIIGENAFQMSSITNIVIPESVGNIGTTAFDECENLAGLTINSGVTNLGQFAFAACYSLSEVSIPKSVQNIPYGAFYLCSALTNVLVPASVTNIVDEAFDGCTNLRTIYFAGYPPNLGIQVFLNDNATLFYLTGTGSWDSFSSQSGLSTVLWNPFIQTTDGNFGVRNGLFGFDITGTTNIPIVVEACTNLANPVWSSLQSLTLSNGLFYFSEPFQATTANRFYRISSP